MTHDEVWRPSPIPATLPQVRHRAAGEVTVRKRDCEPILLSASEGRSDEGNLGRLPRRVCSVCHRAVAEYTCPKCRRTYCSGACFRQHSEACTESFYRRHVESEMKFRASDPDAASESQRDVAGMLARTRLPTDIEAGEIGPEMEERDDAGEADLPIERLAQLAVAAESDSLDKASLSAEERRLFARAVASGELSGQIKPWRPWWTGGSASPAIQEVSHSSSSGRDVSDDVGKKELQPLPGSSDDDCCPSHTLEGLRRLVEASPPPPFASLSGQQRPSPVLPHLVADATFAYASAMRLYNGCWCDEPSGAAEALITASPVLSLGALPTAAAAALEGCAAAAAAAAAPGETAESVAERASILRRDVCAIWENAGLLALALADASAMLGAAAKEAAGAAASAATAATGARGSDGDSRNQKAQKKAANRMVRRAMALAKRLRYFEAWAASHGTEACLEESAALLEAAEAADKRKMMFASKAPSGPRGKLIEEL